MPTTKDVTQLSEDMLRVWLNGLKGIVICRGDPKLISYFIFISKVILTPNEKHNTIMLQKTVTSLRGIFNRIQTTDPRREYLETRTIEVMQIFRGLVNAIKNKSSLEIWNARVSLINQLVSVVFKYPRPTIT